MSYSPSRDFDQLTSAEPQSHLASDSGKNTEEREQASAVRNTPGSSVPSGSCSNIDLDSIANVSDQDETEPLNITLPTTVTDSPIPTQDEGPEKHGQNTHRKSC